MTSTQSEPVGETLAGTHLGVVAGYLEWSGCRPGCEETALKRDPSLPVSSVAEIEALLAEDKVQGMPSSCG